MPGFWRWYDRGARFDFAGTLLGLVFDWKTWLVGLFSGGGVTFMWAALEGRSPLDVWLLALFATTCASIIVATGATVWARWSNRPKSLPGVHPAASQINLSAAPLLNAQEGAYPAKYIQAAVRAAGNLLGCQVMLQQVERMNGALATVVYSHPLHAGWSGIPDVAVDINDGQEQRANFFSVSHAAQLGRYLLVPQTIHRDEALRLAVAEAGRYRLTIRASSKTSAPEQRQFILRWSGSFEDVEFFEETHQDLVEISLFEAATRAYEKTKDKDIGALAEGLTESPDSLLTWYCNYMARHLGSGRPPLIKLRGNQPPSRTKEEIYIDPLYGYDFVVEGQQIVLQERNGHRRYENLTTINTELSAAIEIMSAVKA